MSTTTMEPVMSEQNEDLQVKMGPELSGRLCAVYVKICRPTGAIQLTDAIVEAENKGVKFELTGKFISKPRVRYDIHPLWKDLDTNESNIRRLIKRYTAENMQRGTYLLSMISAGKFQLELANLVEERQNIIGQFQDNQAEVIEAAKEEHEDIWEIIYDQIRLPTRTNCRVEQDYWPLGTLSVDDMDLSDLNPSEKKLIIEQTHERAKEMLENRFKMVFDGVFGEVMEICEQVEKGEFETGKRRSGALNLVMDALERVSNFSHIADADTLERVSKAAGYIKNLSIQDVNNNAAIQSRIRDVFAPVKQAVTKLQDKYAAGQSRSTRDVVI